MSEPVTYWYRLEDRLVSTGEYSPSRAEVTLYKLLVVRRTPKGVRLVGLQYGHDKPRFVAHSSRKKFACETVEEAVASFKRRKERQASILRAQASHADEAHDLAHRGEYRTMPDWFNPKPQEAHSDL